MLERPFDEVLASGLPDFPFCLCWANESWNRAWDGRESETLIRQTYSEQDDLAHMRWLATAFRDRRYVRVDGRALFLVYAATRLPDSPRTASVWRAEARRLGAGELFLCQVASHRARRAPPDETGFDAVVEFQPDTAALLTPFERVRWRLARRVRWRRGALVLDYGALVRRALDEPDPPYTRFPCVTPGWDNSPRRESGPFILRNSTPELYERWLRAAIAKLRPRSRDQKLVFVNAWNEWAEGNHLEPCRRWGRAYLEATRLAGFSTVEAGRFFGRAPKFSAVIECDYLTPWPAEIAEARYLERFARLAR